MSTALFSSSWYRLAKLHPRLRSHTEIHRHLYRGELWYLIQDHFTGRFHRFTPEAYAVIGLMDGSRSLDEIWESVCIRLGDDMPSQDEVIQLLGQLHRADVIQAELPPDMTEVERRRHAIRRGRLVALLKSPLSVRVPLWDPERFLERTRWVSRFLFSWYGAVIWLLLTVTAATLAGIHWQALTGNLADRILVMENLLLLWLVYPVVKGIHEFGHGYAVKRWGGEVHEMGIMFLVFVPVPYVEASAASAFTSKYQRMLVGAAGILSEVFMAAVAMLVWALVEPGAVRAVAFNVMLIAGVSTLLFNGNPLLRFDAYYVLADFLEIPNLGTRANRQLGYLLKRYLLAVPKEEPPARSLTEGLWLVVYSLASFSYRMFIMISIALFVAGKLFIVGAILALWSFYGFLAQPIINMIRYLIMDEQMKKKHLRIVLAGSSIALVLALLLFGLPVTRTTLTEGVLWVPERTRVIAAQQGIVDAVLVHPGQRTTTGMPLIRTTDIELETRVRVVAASVRELEARERVAQSLDKTTEAQLVREEIERSAAQLARLREKLDALLIRSPAEGVFHVSRSEDLPGRFLRRGESLGYVLQPGTYMARVVVEQADIDAVRGDVQALEVRLAEAVDKVLAAELVREVPTARPELPSVALSVEGGGRYALDPGITEVPTAFEPLFQFEIMLEQVPAHRIGERLYVLFTHTPEPIGFRWWRAARRVLLERLDL